MIKTDIIWYDLSIVVFNFKKQLHLCDRDYSFLCVISDKDYFESEDLNKQFRIYLETCTDYHTSLTWCGPQFKTMVYTIQDHVTL